MWATHTKRKNFKNIDYVTPTKGNRKVALNAWGLFQRPETCFCQHRNQHYGMTEEMKIKLEVKYLVSDNPARWLKCWRAVLKGLSALRKKCQRPLVTQPPLSFLQASVKEIRWNAFIYLFILGKQFDLFHLKVFPMFSSVLSEMAAIPLSLWTKNKLGFSAVKNRRLAESTNFKMVLIVCVEREYWKQVPTVACQGAHMGSCRTAGLCWRD